MKSIRLIFIIILIVGAIGGCSNSTRENALLKLHPVNPHYFLHKEKPEILIGSTEHYGAVMNLDFDYVKYLDELKYWGLNITRTFSGVYVEPQGAFGILKNTLAPAYGRYICPWARSNEPGYANGGNKFDLAKWDKAYFTRLKDFLSEANKRDIIVELDLFSNFYDTLQWKMSPLYIGNNINNIGNTDNPKEILSLHHSELLGIQEKMVRKIVHELKDFDNLYYEVCNEPYFGDTLALVEWEKHMTGIVVDAEREFNQKHLISNNIANNFRYIPNNREGVSVYNFHYARPPVTVKMNYHLNKPVGDNETGFDGIDDSRYRIEAWNFILAGGALFNNLDYSFTTENEDGSFVIKAGEPGGGGKMLRNQLKILGEFMHTLDFISMEPVKEESIKISSEAGTDVQALGKNNEVYAIYLSRKDTSMKKSTLEIKLASGSYRLKWLDTKTGDESNEDLNDQKEGWAVITSPAFSEDIALRIFYRNTN
jgi:hypothetical protein